MIVHQRVPAPIGRDVVARLYLHEAAGAIKVHERHGAGLCVETDHPDDTAHVRGLIAAEQDRRVIARYWEKLAAKRRLVAKRRHYQTL